MNKHSNPTAQRVPLWVDRLPAVLDRGPCSKESSLHFSKTFGPACLAVVDWGDVHFRVLRDLMVAVRPYSGASRGLVTAAAALHRQAAAGKPAVDQEWRDLMSEALTVSQGDMDESEESAAAEAVRNSIWAARRGANPRSLAEGISDTISCARLAAANSAHGRKKVAQNRRLMFGDDIRSRVIAALGE